MILSVDLASRRYRDIGIALMHENADGVQARLVSAERDLALSGAPEVGALANALVRLAQQHAVRLVLIDGPQGWRADASPLVHNRVCERETRTPGKTGLPGIVKPRTWTGFAEFSVALFDALHRAGWPRLDAGWDGEPAAIESFPTHAWRCLGGDPLPGKGRKPDQSPWTAWRSRLEQRGVHGLPDTVSHDELQAVVAGLAGLQLLSGGLGACDVRGQPPRLEHGSWREGYIVSPRAVAN